MFVEKSELFRRRISIQFFQRPIYIIQSLPTIQYLISTSHLKPDSSPFSNTGVMPPATQSINPLTKEIRRVIGRLLDMINSSGHGIGSFIEDVEKLVDRFHNVIDSEKALKEENRLLSERLAAVERILKEKVKK